MNLKQRLAAIQARCDAAKTRQEKYTIPEYERFCLSSMRLLDDDIPWLVDRLRHAVEVLEKIGHDPVWSIDENLEGLERAYAKYVALRRMAREALEELNADLKQALGCP